MKNNKQRVSKKIIIPIFLLLLWTIDTVQAESQIQALYKIKGIQVGIKVTDPTTQRISKDINNEELKKYAEERLSALLKEDRDIELFHKYAPVLNILITIEEKNYKESSDVNAINKSLYYADIKATILRGKYKWISEQSCSWQEKKVDKDIERLQSLIAVRNVQRDIQATRAGMMKAFGFDAVHNYTMDNIKDTINSDYELLYQKVRKLTFQYAIEQTLNEIVDSFAGDYILTQGLPDGLEHQLGYDEELPLSQSGTNAYTEYKNRDTNNSLYEAGSIIRLSNISDTCFALYKDDSLSNATNLFSNGAKAKIMDYKALPDKPVVYKIQMLLKDGSEYIGWVPESVISN